MQALPPEPGIGKPGGGANWMDSVAAVGARDVWAVGTICPHLCSRRTLVEHWAGAGWRTIPPSPRHRAAYPPAPAAVMERRILVNYRVDPDLLGSYLPAPFRPAAPDSAFLMSGLSTIWHPQPRLRVIAAAGRPTTV